MRLVLKILRPTLLSVAVFVHSSVLAATPEELGLQIATEVDLRDQGFSDSTAEMKMLLTNKQGETRERFVRVKTLEVVGDGDKSLSIFDRPKDVKGTAFLTFSHALQPDDQWLYLPALKRVKRISSKNKSGPFMGSEFAYEDIASQEVEKYSYKYLRDEKLEETDSFVIERYPSYENSGYARQIIWIEKQRYIPIQIEYYDRKDALLKTLKFKNYRQYLDKHWRALEMYMENHQTGKTTLLSWENYQFKTGLQDNDFHKNSLKRVK